MDEAESRRVELCSWLGIDTDTGWSDAVVEMSKRLMPKGMEWPRYEDGEKVGIGDDVVGPDYGERIKVNDITFHANGFTLRDQTGFRSWYENDDRFKRQKPYPIGADGLPIKNGDTVWHKSGLASGVVSSIDYESLMRTVRYISSDGTEFRDAAKDLTHTKPEPKRLCRDCRHWKGDPSASHMGVCFNSYMERCCVDSYEARLDYAEACEDFEGRGE